MCFEACPITEEARLPTLPIRPHSQSYLAFVEDTEALMGVLCPSATSFYICAIVFQCSLSDPVMKDMAPVPFWCPGLLETTVPHQGSELHNPKTISSTSSSQRLRAPKLVQSMSHSMLTPSCSKQATNTRKRWGRMGNTNYLKGRCQQTLASQDQLDQTQTLQSPLRVNEGMETVLTLSKPLLPTLPSYPRTVPCTGLTLQQSKEIMPHRKGSNKSCMLAHLPSQPWGGERKKDGEEYKARGS